MNLYFYANAAFSVLLLTMGSQSLYADSNITYFAPTHPDVCSEKKATPEAIVIPETKVEAAPLPEPIVLKESNSDNDGVVDSNNVSPLISPRGDHFPK